MTRVLWLASATPSRTGTPLQQRAFQFLRTAPAEHTPTLVTWGPVDNELSELADVVTLPWSRRARVGLAPRLARKLSFWAGGRPPWVRAALEERGLMTAAGRERLAAAVRSRGPFDLVVLADEVAACLPVRLPAVPRAVHRLNVFSRAIADHVAHGGRYRVRWALERGRWEAFDRSLVSGATRVFTPTPESALALRALHPACNPVVVTSGVELPSPSIDPATGTDVAFVGWMAYPPNVEAVRWFSEVCWPDLTHRRPSSRFRIVGRAPAPEVGELARRSGVDVTGEVPDVAAACVGTRVGVVPLHHGMGIKTKALELMAMGLPVVATPCGGEGIGAGAADGLVIAESVATFTAAVQTLLDDAELAARLGAAARAYVEAHHSWDAAGAEHARHLDSILSTTREAQS